MRTWGATAARAGLVAIALMMLAACAGAPAPSGPVTAGGATSTAAPSAPATPAYDAPRVTPEQARQLVGAALIILDVRSASDYKSGHIEGAINIPWANIRNDYSQLPKDRFILLYCT